MNKESKKKSKKLWLKKHSLGTNQIFNVLIVLFVCLIAYQPSFDAKTVLVEEQQWYY